MLRQVFFGGSSQPSLYSCLPLPPGEVTRRVLRGVSKEAVSLQPGSKQHEGLVGVPGSTYEDLAHLTEAMDRMHDMGLRNPHNSQDKKRLAHSEV